MSQTEDLFAISLDDMIVEVATELRYRRMILFKISGGPVQRARFERRMRIMEAIGAYLEQRRGHSTPWPAK